jgi:hypothetical protein
MLVFGLIVGGSVAISYAIDCFPEIGGESMASVMVIRNTIGFALSYAITPWWTGMGRLRVHSLHGNVLAVHVEGKEPPEILCPDVLEVRREQCGWRALSKFTPSTLSAVWRQETTYLFMMVETEVLEIDSGRVRRMAMFEM